MIISKWGHNYFVGISKKFQGFCFDLSFDNPNAGYTYWLFEFKFTWFKFWVTWHEREV